MTALEATWTSIFNEYLLPLQQRNGNLPIVFIEFGYVNSPAALDNAITDEFMSKDFKDRDGNGLDDGEEVQSNTYEALFNVMERFPDAVRKAFLGDVGKATANEYRNNFATMRTFHIRDKLAEVVARDRYLA